MGHDEVYPLRDGVQGKLDDETPSKEGNLSCDVASRLSKTAITENQENASKSATTAVCMSTAGCENSRRKDVRLHCCNNLYALQESKEQAHPRA